jgi:putative endopeptidase
MKSNNINLKDFNLKVKPTDDFFEFVSGGWVKKNPIPGDQSSWDTFRYLRDLNQNRLKQIFSELKKNAKSADQKKIRDYYISGLDIKSRDSRGIKELEPLLCEIDEIKNYQDFFEKLGRFHRLGFRGLWGSFIDQDDKDSTKYIFRIVQGGLGLPNRDYYLKTDKQSKKIRNEYVKYIINIFSLAGFDKSEAARFSAIIMRLETHIARISYDKVKLRDPHLNYNKFRYGDLARKYPNILWKEYFKAIKVSPPKDLIVSQTKYFSDLNKMVQKASLSDLRVYLKFRLLSRSSNSLTSGFFKANFDFFGRIMMGLKQPKPLWKRVMAEVEGSMGEAIGREYVKRYFPERAKGHVIKMTREIKAAMGDRINALDWMSKETKKKALQKLAKFSQKIGYPDKWNDYSKLKISRDSYFSNSLAADVFHFDKMMKKLSKKTVDRKEWLMHPQDVNAYCHFNFNEIVFPAGILVFPFFDENVPDAMNYGGIGAVIGHEITHAFDDQGSKFDKIGNLSNWWGKSDRKNFEKKTKVLEKQYSNMEILPGVKINGKLTMGENIADLGGIIIAYHGYIKSLKNKNDLYKKVGKFTNAELFFIGYAMGWRGHSRDEYLKQIVLTDPHSPPKQRVLGVLPNMDEFYEIFGCKPGDKMYLPEDKRARIW